MRTYRLTKSLPCVKGGGTATPWRRDCKKWNYIQTIPQSATLTALLTHSLRVPLHKGALRFSQYHPSAGRSKRLHFNRRDFDVSGREIRTSLRSPRAREGVGYKEGNAFPALLVFFGAFFYHKKKATTSVKLHLGIIKKLVYLKNSRLSLAADT